MKKLVLLFCFFGFLQATADFGERGNGIAVHSDWGEKGNGVAGLAHTDVLNYGEKGNG